MADKFRIAIAARDAVGTGGGTVAIKTADRFSELGHEVTFVSDYPIQSLNPKIVQINMPLGYYLKNWKPKIKIIKRLKHLVQVLSFSVFGLIAIKNLERKKYVSIDHNGEAMGGQITVFHNVFKTQSRSDNRSFTKRLGQYFNPLFWFRLWREDYILRSRRSAIIVAVSTSALKEVEELIPIHCPSRVIYSGIDLAAYSPAKKDEALVQLEGREIQTKFVVGFISHEFESKRLDLVISALKYCGSEVELLVVGGRDSNKERYVLMARSLGVEHRVKFMGTREDIPSILAECSVFAFPSDYETWGMVAIEALASGVPVIMTDVGCGPIVIRDYETGFIVPQDAEVIGRRIEEIRLKEGLLDTMKAFARAEVERFSWERTADKYLEAIMSISDS